ncbi:RtcB family protein, partial [Candidatus Pacearchaeota archaeon]|nr:RtcB family protein [Candidatus Pacearchaeota archaeon]
AVNTFSGFECSDLISKKEAIIAKLIGYMFGDGAFYQTRNKIYAVAYGSLEDLQKIKEDLESIEVNSSIFSRERKHDIRTRYGSVKFEAVNHELHIYQKRFLEELRERGLLLGNKTRQKINIPSWIRKGNKLIKRLFLAGFFGAEMSSPNTSSKTCFFCPTIDQNKIESLKENAREFLIEIALMLEEFGIKDWKISEMPDYKNKYGENTTRFRLFITGEDNMLKLWRQIGFEYNKKRQSLANIASLYALLKRKENEKRQELAIKIKKYKSRGLSLKEIQKILSGKINERFIERHYYEDAKQRINLDFISFKDFKKDKLNELLLHGAIFDPIENISKIEGSHRVYDFNIQDNHNFIANSFIVSNCGVRLLATNLTKEQFLKKREQILNDLFKAVPSGVGKDSEFKLDTGELDEVLNSGMQWAVKKGYAIPDDIKNIEDNGCIKNADSSKVSQRAKSRGKGQLGSLGSGNHFLEIQEVESIFNKEIAETYGLKKGQIVVMIHSGSRGLGHQTATDYLMKMEKAYGFKHLPDRQLAYAPLKDPIAQEYIKAMNCAANFAFVNRQLITYQIRKIFNTYFKDSEIRIVYDLAHNIAKFEKHKVNGKEVELCIHRKGATRSFGPGRKEIPEDYRKVGCPIFIPGSMGTFSYVLAGTKKAEEISFASTAHGAGRVLSRSYAIKNLKETSVRAELSSKDILLKAGSRKGMLEEAPEAYKDIDEVARVSDELGIGQLVARLKPLAVIKG